MTKADKSSKTLAFVRELCKGLSEEKLLEAEQNFMDYLLVVKEMCDRIERDSQDTPAIDDCQNE